MEKTNITAKLVAHTVPTYNVPATTPEDLIAFCARVSSKKDYKERADNYEGLLKYCMKNKHWSIFEMSNAVVEVNAPRDITRQLLRHRSFSFQEFSQRYSDNIDFTDREYRSQDSKNRQNSIDNLPAYINTMAKGYTMDFQDNAREAYKHLVNEGVAKECARVLLPEGLTMSTLYVNGTFRSWLHYLDVRNDPGVTQHEHVVLAREIKKALKPVMPTLLGMNDDREKAKR